MMDLFFRFRIWRDWRRYITESYSGLMVVIGVFTFRYKRTSSAYFLLPKLRPDSLLKSCPILSIMWRDFCPEWKNCGGSELPPELSQAMGSILICPNRIGFWPLYLAGISKRASCASSIFSHAKRDDFVGACNDIKAFIADQELLSMSLLISDGTESKANTEK